VVHAGLAPRPAPGADRRRARLLQPPQDVHLAGPLRRRADADVDTVAGGHGRGRGQHEGREAGQGALRPADELHPEVRGDHLRGPHADADGGRRHGRHDHDPAPGSWPTRWCSSPPTTATPGTSGG
jgi:hypothetical protein